MLESRSLQSNSQDGKHLLHKPSSTRTQFRFAMSLNHEYQTVILSLLWSNPSSHRTTSEPCTRRLQSSMKRKRFARVWCRTLPERRAKPGICFQNAKVNHVVWDQRVCDKSKHARNKFARNRLSAYHCQRNNQGVEDVSTSGREELGLAV